QLSDHVSKRHPAIRLWECPMCGIMFDTCYELFLHQYYEHIEGHFKCSFKNCTVVKATYDEIVLHYKLTHADRTLATSYPCRLLDCGKHFQSHRDLVLHQRSEAHF